jgi:hypothetical protein
MPYIDYGKEEGLPRNAILIACADNSGNIQHVYAGYRRGNEFVLYPFRPINPTFRAMRKRIHVDDLLPLEQLRILREEATRRNA